MADDATWFADMIRQGKRKLADVPAKDREAVQALLRQDQVREALENRKRWGKSGYLGQMPKEK